MPFRFALNRTRAPQLPLQDFIALATSVGVQAVKIRNDIEGREFADGLRQLRPILQAQGVTGYIGPLGMQGSTMTLQDMAVAALTDIDGSQLANRPEEHRADPDRDRQRR